jgi:glutathione S-transferase
MKLYSIALSPYAARVRAAIYAKDLAIDIVAPPDDWRTSAEYRRLNPLVRIPVLVLDDGTGIPESGVIVEYLEDTHREPTLRPRTPEGLARVRLITQVAEFYVMPVLMPLFFLFDSKTRDEAAIDSQLGKLDQALAQLNGLLHPGGYALGERVTTADVWLAPVRFSLEGLMGFSGRTGLLDRYAAIAGYADVAQRDPALGRVWREMADGLKAFMASRAGAPKNS